MAWSLAQLKDYIYQTAPSYGIDPNVAWSVWSKEGANSGVFNGPGGTPGSGWYATYQNDAGHSLGPFQLYDKGLGATFKAQTGLPISPDTIKEQADFSLRQASQGGWTPWHAAANTGVSKWAGIDGKGGGAPTGNVDSGIGAGFLSTDFGGGTLSGLDATAPTDTGPSAVSDAQLQALANYYGTGSDTQSAWQDYQQDLPTGSAPTSADLGGVSAPGPLTDASAYQSGGGYGPFVSDLPSSTGPQDAAGTPSPPPASGGAPAAAGAGAGAPGGDLGSLAGSIAGAIPGPAGKIVGQVLPPILSLIQQQNPIAAVTGSGKEQQGTWEQTGTAATSAGDAAIAKAYAEGASAVAKGEGAVAGATGQAGGAQAAAETAGSAKIAQATLDTAQTSISTWKDLVTRGFVALFAIVLLAAGVWALTGKKPPPIILPTPARA